LKNTVHQTRLCTIFELLLCIGLLLFFQQPLAAEESPPLSVTEQYDILKGEWQRTDGNYSLKLSNIQKDGQVQAEYFNPKPIHIGEAAVSTQKELIRLFLKFQDQNYEGSTYTLYYYAEKDALAGFYYQAVLNRTYEVVFLRKEN